MDLIIGFAALLLFFFFLRWLFTPKKKQDVSQNEVNNASPSNDFHFVTVGVAHRRSAYKGVEVGDDLYLKQEPNNEYDSRAVAVFHKPTGKQIGYVASEYCYEINQIINHGASYEVMAYEKEPIRCSCVLTLDGASLSQVIS